MKLNIALILIGMVAACAHKETFEVAKDSAKPSSHIDWLGQPTRLEGEGQLQVNEPLPEMEITNSHMKQEKLKTKGSVKLISILPSLDTEVCERQTQLLNDTVKLDPRVERLTISRDLPYAQSRFAQDAKLKNVAFLSDYRKGALGHALGLEIERNGLLARAVVVLDAQGIVRYYQIVPKIYALPDMQRAYEVANSLVR